MWHFGRFSSLAAGAAGLFMISAYPAMGATEKSEPARQVAANSSASPSSKERTEIYMGLFMMGNFPSNRALKFENDPYPNTEVGGGLGGGLKVGVYPAFTNRIVGVEAELAGFNANVEAPQTTSGGVTRQCGFPIECVQRDGQPHGSISRRRRPTICRNRRGTLRRVRKGPERTKQLHGNHQRECGRRSICLSIDRRATGERQRPVLPLQRIQIFCREL